MKNIGPGIAPGIIFERVEREELSDVVWRMTGMYVFRHFGQDNIRVVPKKNRIYRRIVLPIDTIII
jgi:hypothetical protein